MIAVRPYRAEDRAACAGIFFRAVREGTAQVFNAARREAWAPSPLPDLTRADKLLDQWCLVAWRGATAVGFLSMTPAGYLDMAFVLPEEMGRGTAGLLYAPLEARARQEGVARLTAWTSPLARRFLEKRGWHLEKVEPFHIGDVDYKRFGMALDLLDGRTAQG